MLLFDQAFEVTEVEPLVGFALSLTRE